MCVLFTAPKWIWVAGSEEDVGSIRPLFLDRPSPPDLGHTDRTMRHVPIRSGLLIDQRARVPREVPARVVIRAIGVDAPVVPVGVREGTTEIPPDGDQVGWYRFGGRLGEGGSTLLVAHVSTGAGPGAFFRLRELTPGAEVLVTTRGGSRVVFSVIALRWYRKVSLPGRVFRRSGPPLLTLVTCGGTFSTATGRYEQNLVVFAASDV
jgi:hypothetical protein